MVSTDPVGSLLPAPVLVEAGRVLGSPVVACERLTGGFSGQLNCVLRLEDSRTAVVKTSQDGDMAVQHGVPWTDILDREIWMYAHLDGVDRFRPAFYGSVRAAGGWD